MFAPVNVNVPVPSFVKVPEPVAIGSFTVVFPDPPKVIAVLVPVIAFPELTSKVNVPLSELILVVPERVINPAIELLPEIFLKAPPLEIPVPTKVISSPAASAIPPINSKAAPLETEVLPAVVPNAVLCAACKTPAETVVSPV